MKSTLLATVAVAALAIGGTMAIAQERGGSDMKTSPAQSGAMGGAEKSAPEKSAPRAAQAEPNRGAAQADHATGRQRAAEQRGASEPNHETGQARAEDRRSDMNKSSAADTDASKQKSSAAESDKSKSQAQQERKEPSRTGANEPSRDRTKGQAQNERSEKSKSQSTAAGERDHKADQAQKVPDSKEQMKSGAASSAQDKNTASAPQNKSGSGSERMGANGRDNSGTNAAQNRSSSEDVNVTGSIQVDRQKASRVHDELIRNAPRTNVDISVNVGTTLPSHVHVRPVPASIVSISPEFRGYDYVVVHDEIVIVEPRTKKVVTIIESNGRPHKAQRASFTLNQQQKSRIRSDIKLDSARQFDVEVSQGRPVPQTVVLQPLPEVIYSDVPEARDYRYFVDDRRIIIVDPDTREVVDIID